jgi:aspartate aminotransferase-like enzyme
MQKDTVAPHALRRGRRPRVANSKAGPGYDYRGRERPSRSGAFARAALMNRDLCHRESEFADLQDDIPSAAARRLWPCVGGLRRRPAHRSGTAAVEAMLSSLISQTGELLVPENGVYGERLTRCITRCLRSQC